MWRRSPSDTVMRLRPAQRRQPRKWPPDSAGDDSISSRPRKQPNPPPPPRSASRSSLPTSHRRSFNPPLLPTEVRGTPSDSAWSRGRRFEVHVVSATRPEGCGTARLAMRSLPAKAKPASKLAWLHVLTVQDDIATKAPPRDRQVDLIVVAELVADDQEIVIAVGPRYLVPGCRTE
jgi:hypothetical protein